ncbi:MAG: peptide ABC transporter substrate-binding protein, partial [Spirochaetaceae bacterium]|nr:peptide ABC transporter substrate-binding protein [Spirochaetaceae bacterium]
MKTRILAFLMIFTALSLAVADNASPDELVTVFNKSPLEFDIHKSIYSTEAQVFTALYEGLCSYDPASLDPVAAAASSWTKSADGKTYTFTIRENARWSDGSPLTSQDFRNSWLRMLKLNADYATFFDIIEGAHAYRLGTSTNPESVGISCPDMKTLVVKLIRPAAYFTRLLCHHSFAPIHPSMLEEESWSEWIPFPVNGPYRFSSYDGDSLRLEKNPFYWDEKSVSIPKLTMLFTDDDAEASRMFNNDEAQWLAGPGDYDTVLLQEAIQVNPIFATHYWYFNCGKAPWDDARVRKALALLVPWNTVRDSELYAVTAETLVLPLPGYSEAKGISEADKTKAFGLLEEAGFPEGAGLPELQMCFADGNDPLRVATAFKSAWTEAIPSLRVKLVPIRSVKYYALIKSGE